jgi:hypothetical protein
MSGWRDRERWKGSGRSKVRWRRGTVHCAGRGKARRFNMLAAWSWTGVPARLRGAFAGDVRDDIGQFVPEFFRGSDHGGESERASRREPRGL